MGMAAESGMRIVRQASDEGRNMALRALRDPSFDGVRNSFQSIWSSCLELLERIRHSAVDMADPNFLYDQLQLYFRDEISRNNMFFVCVGLGLGTAGGFLLGLWLARPSVSAPVMKSISCSYFGAAESVSLTRVSVPQMFSDTDILIRIRAASFHRLDEQITRGYGRTLRRMISNTPETPLVLGRAAAGVVEAVGRDCRSGLEIGDEVWLVAPWYAPGVAAEVAVVPESRVGRKPFITGFEGAASLPYSGCVAMGALKQADLGEHNCAGKRILVQDGCSPVGCVLTQLAKKWGATVTATCYVRSVPVIRALGADDVITLRGESPSDGLFLSTDSSLVEKFNLSHALATREVTFDVIFFTTFVSYDKSFLHKYLSPGGRIIDTCEMPLLSDDLGFLGRCFLSCFVALRRFAGWVIRSPPDWGGPHLCHLTLDRLAGYVNEGLLQTVVDQVFTPEDAQRAIEHICSEKAIGSTIVTFRDSK
ncbi:reticulon-4-interacting protein 1, mitochondrial-like isoform X2 [Phlebotomus papatasi]|nr:reticulon-4-interacting protein 1, mitochondrial-like isoform X2 [Phlebotomus papatasi]XP_055704647.1 reticulon-4-interacting protein 1, mitochondrial-like isoform X2 [Phlebotomus papatasi]